MNKFKTYILNLFRIFVQIKFLVISAVNYLFGNFIFAFFWTLNNEKFQYLIVAVPSTLIASIFSYQVQSRYLVNSANRRPIVSPIFLAIQLANLGVSAIMVPFLSKETSLGLIPIQFLWSGFISVISIILIYTSENIGEARSSSSA